MDQGPRLLSDVGLSAQWRVPAAGSPRELGGRAGRFMRQCHEEVQRRPVQVRGEGTWTTPPDGRSIWVTCQKRRWHRRDCCGHRALNLFPFRLRKRGPSWPVLRRGNEGVAECKGRARSGTWQALSLWRWRCHLPVPGTCCPACCEKPDDASTSPHVPLYLPYLHRPTLFSKPKFWKNRLFSVSPSSEHPYLASSPIRHQSCYRSGPQHLLLRTVDTFQTFRQHRRPRGTECAGREGSGRGAY